MGKRRKEQAIEKPPTRRSFLKWTAAAAAVYPATRVTQAGDLAYSIRDRWLYARLSRHCPRLKPGVSIWRGEADEIEIGWDSTGPAFALNETAAFLLRACDGHNTVERLALDLCTEFGAPLGEARMDTALTIRALARIGVIEV